MNNLKNTNLEVSSFALGCVEKVVKEFNKFEEEKNDSQDVNKEKEKKIVKPTKYKTLVKKMSVLIQKNGYIGTLVFCYSKSQKNKEHEEVLKNIINWTKKNHKLINIKNDKDLFIFRDMETEVFDDYIKIITTLSQRQYMLITKEMMILFGWMKRFADGMIEGEDENGD